MMAAAITANGKKVIKCQGHQTLDYLLTTLIPRGVNAKRLAEIETVSAVGVARDPEQRFISQVMAFMAIKNETLDKAMLACLHQSHIVFKPQYLFYQTPKYEVSLPYVGVEIYPMERMDLAQAAVGNKQPEPWHKNKGDWHWYVLKKITAHPMFQECMDMFSPDWAVYETAVREWADEANASTN